MKCLTYPKNLCVQTVNRTMEHVEFDKIHRRIEGNPDPEKCFLSQGYVCHGICNSWKVRCTLLSSRSSLPWMWRTFNGYFKGTKPRCLQLCYKQYMLTSRKCHTRMLKNSCMILDMWYMDLLLEVL